jgi:DNA-binding NarL/FixJ family response regulator
MIPRVADGGRIRILMAGLSPMMYDIVREALESEPDMTVMDCRDCAALPDAIETHGAAVVIIGTSDPAEPTLPFTLLDDHCRVKVLMLATSGDRAMLYELRPHRTSLGDVSPRRLLDAIRAALSHDRLGRS